jgi:hypothetical protein
MFNYKFILYIFGWICNKTQSGMRNSTGKVSKLCFRNDAEEAQSNKIFEHQPTVRKVRKTHATPDVASNRMTDFIGTRSSASSQLHRLKATRVQASAKAAAPLCAPIELRPAAPAAQCVSCKAVCDRGECPASYLILGKQRQSRHKSSR